MPGGGMILILLPCWLAGRPICWVWAIATRAARARETKMASFIAETISYSTRSHASVFGRSLVDAIDHQALDGRGGFFQLQADLFESGGVCFAAFATPPSRQARSVEDEIPGSGNSGFIHHRQIGVAWARSIQKPDQLPHGCL